MGLNFDGVLQLYLVLSGSRLHSSYMSRPDVSKSFLLIDLQVVKVSKLHSNS